MKRGYFALYRKFQDHPFWKEHRVFSKSEAWIDILWEAQYDPNPTQVILDMTVLTQEYGETLKSVRTWARRWNWSESKVRRFFKLLEKMNQIRTKSEGVTTRLTVINYIAYDPKRRASDAQATHERRTSDAQAATKEEGKEIKKERKPPLPPYEEIIDQYHKILPELAAVIKISPELKTKIHARCKSDKDRYSIEWWIWYFKNIRYCDWLMGKKGDWSATLDWLTGPKNMQKVISGNYLNKNINESEIERWINE